MPQSRPNILYIMSDDHSTNVINCYGGWLNEVVDTPNLDRIAQEGMRFEHCYCNNSLCSPSRASIITGQYSHKNGVTKLNGPLADDHPSFARQLQADGYQTAVVGKWHLKSDPVGFDHYEILPGQGNYFNPHFDRNGQTTHYQGYATDIITDLSLEWLQKRDPDRPFLMMCHHKAPHGLWEFAPRHAELFRDGDLPEPSNLYETFREVSDAFRNHQRDILAQA
ncbi:MAG: sulfatase-like hydrolase/transferase, partial [bacterium]|nr:sulfatase-like hydrolase/transferase [bacterium]